MSNIAAAFVKAQRGFAPALKEKNNPAFKGSKYADLGACIDAVIESLHANGIALIQRTLPDDSGVTVTTVFLHESGEQFDGGALHVPAAKNDPQGYGSALTYARRYSLMAACGIAPEDDDGNAATKAKAAEAESDPWQGWTPDQAKRIRLTAQECIQAFTEGREFDAYGSYSAMLARGTDAGMRMRIQLALSSAFQPHSALRASIKKHEEAERVGEFKVPEKVEKIAAGPGLKKIGVRATTEEST
jgi:hypothetical protein